MTTTTTAPTTKTVRVTQKGWNDKAWTMKWLRKLGTYDASSRTWDLTFDHPRANDLLHGEYVEEVA